MSSYSFFGKAVSGRFTVPSGIVTVSLDTLALLAREISPLGILTTKSIGPQVRAGNPEPVFAGAGGGSYVNAVGLANPGADEFASELQNLHLPDDKFLLISIFGATIEDFQQVAGTLAPYADGFELNFSCPHAKGYGQEIGKNPEVASEYLTAVKAVTELPVLPKLSPNVGDLAPLVSALVAAGADGFTVINTFGPKEYRSPLSETPVLSNRVGGMSGRGVKKEALRCIRQVRDAVRQAGKDLPIVGMGGIESWKDVADFEAAGASFFGVGSALTGKDTRQVREFFESLESETSDPSIATDRLMEFRAFHVARVEQPAEDLKILWTEEEYACEPGQFVFVWLPGKMEKPFAPAFDSPAALVVRKVGPFTSELMKLGKGDTFYMRGPYGRGFDARPDPEPDTFCLVGGGTGIAPLLLLARDIHHSVAASRIHIFLGGRDASQIYFRDEFKQYATLHVSTDDGSEGYSGLVTALLSNFLEAHRDQRFQFYNCGPERMEKTAFDLQLGYPHTGIQTSIERYMKCGVGICGICSMDGLRTCVDGPVLDKEPLLQSNHFGQWRRRKTGELEPIQ